MDFDSRPVTLSPAIAQACSLRLAATAGIGVRDEFGVCPSRFTDLVEGGYIQPNGLLTRRGVQAAATRTDQQRLRSLIARVDRRWNVSLAG